MREIRAGACVRGCMWVLYTAGFVVAMLLLFKGKLVDAVLLIPVFAVFTFPVGYITGIRATRKKYKNIPRFIRIF